MSSDVGVPCCFVPWSFCPTLSFLLFSAAVAVAACSTIWASRMITEDWMVGDRHGKCRLAKALPEPDLRYFSEAAARSLSANCTAATTRQGLYLAVCGESPRSCARRRSWRSSVSPP